MLDVHFYFNILHAMRTAVTICIGGNNHNAKSIPKQYQYNPEQNLICGNIGSTARAMKNMGLSNLYLVDPQCEVDGEARKMATHGKDILDNIKVFDSIRDAASDSNYIFGTTARNRK